MTEHNNPKISILVPLYNQEKYFGKCIRSICKQTYKNLEIIVVNDGSTDRSLEILQHWARKDKRIKVIDKENGGVVKAREDAYRLATGDFVAFVDSDDMLPVRSIELLTACILENGVDLVMGHFDKLLGSITTRRKADKSFSSRPFPCDKLVAQPELFDEYYENFFCSSSMFSVSMWAKLYRKSIIDKALQDTELFSNDITMMGEDLYFNMKLFPYLSSAYLIDESVYKYRFGGGTHGFNKNMPQVLTLCDKRLESLDQFKYAKGYEPLFGEYVAFVYNHASQLVYFKKGDKEDVINFFKQELTIRKLIPRLEEFYTSRQQISVGVKCLLGRDYDGMYAKASALSKNTYGSVKFRVLSYLVKLISHCC